MKYRFRSLTLALFVLVLCGYVAVYVALSLNGRYQPAGWGACGVKWYSWAPAGFVRERDSHWSGPMMCVFLPLYYVDTHYWHRDADSDSGKYPVNWVDFPSSDTTADLLSNSDEE